MILPSIRLKMLVSDPWEFGTGPVVLDVLERPSDLRWVVRIIANPPKLNDGGDAYLQTRHEGAALSSLLKGEVVSVNLGLGAGAGVDFLVGSVELLS